MYLRLCTIPTSINLESWVFGLLNEFMEDKKMNKEKLEKELNKFMDYLHRCNTLKLPFSKIILISDYLEYGSSKKDCPRCKDMILYLTSKNLYVDFIQSLGDKRSPS